MIINTTTMGDTVGYEVRRTIRLEFEDPDGGESAVIRLRAASIGELDAFFRPEEGAELSTNDLLASHLVEWNLTSDGEQIPADAAGIRQLDIPLRDQIAQAYLETIQKVPHPLALKSAGGPPSDPPPMTMENL